MSDSYQIHTISTSYLNELSNYNYLIVDKATKLAALVDPSWELDRILTVIEGLDVKLHAILLTHSHFDHVNLVELLSIRYAPNVYISAKEARYYAFTAPNLHTFNDLDTISLGNTTITCMLTPGHTAGSACYLLSGCLITGDTLFIEGCGRCDTTGGNPDDMFDSLQKIRDTVPIYARVYPGHSYGKEPGYPLWYLLENNIYFHLVNRAQFISFRMRHAQGYGSDARGRRK
ncbi:MBL fold metallo-hydrolase [Brevibacillus porteri]|uniref:MBL fold metallo-hydrolase n=1 Tax=Brevibacillus porteri TaxID=2126350 RepID=UPI003D214C21